MKNISDKTCRETETHHQ